MRPSRPVIVASMCFALGAAVSILIAEYCVLRSPVDYGTMNGFRSVPSGRGWTQELEPSRPGLPTAEAESLADALALLIDPAWRRQFDAFPLERRRGVWASQGRGVRVDTVALITDDKSLRSFEVRRLRAGWPFLCLQGIARTPQGGPRSTSGLVRPPVALVLDLQWVPAKLGLPATPIWPGLLANSAVFGLAFLSVPAGTAALRRRLRRRRDQCPACGYDRRGLAAGAPCPECGPWAG